MRRGWSLGRLRSGTPVPQAGAEAGEGRSRARWRLLAGAAFAAVVLGLTGAGVYAILDATATGSENVSSGTLSLTAVAGSGSVGFGATVSNMAPGDITNTYVDLTNGGTLSASNLTLAVSGSGSTLLTTSATDGLAVAVTSCSTAWTVATGSCGGTTTALLASTPVANLGAPAAVGSGSIAAGAILHLQVQVLLPDQNETTVNGSLPSPTIQGLSTTLSFSFDEQQRPAVTTNE